MAEEVDAIVVGSGINGLVAAAELAGAGWSVRLIEQNMRLGGFIASEERTVPGYIHDTYSSWHPQFVSGAAFASLGADLSRNGLTYANTDGALAATVGKNDRAVIAYRDPQRTASEFADQDDRLTYLAVLEALRVNMPSIGELMGNEPRGLATLRALVALLLRNRLNGSEKLLRDVLSSGKSWCRNEFNGSEVDRLWAPWLLHAGLSPDNASGGLMIPLLAGTIHQFGLPVVQGGAQRLVDAFVGLLHERGVLTNRDTRIERIVVEDGRAVGVTTTRGEEFRSRRAVLASVTPSALYSDLLSDRVTPVEVRLQARRYRFGRGEMQIHIALSSPPRWTDSRLAHVPLIHVSDGSATIAVACAQAEAGLLPSEPTIVVGQQYVLDPARVPQGAASLWVQLQEVPYQPVGDASGRLDTSSGWTETLAREYSSRVIARIAQHAPGLENLILAVDVITPVDLERYNPNARFGDPYGGSAELDQSFLWRPLAGAGRHKTGIEGLWHIGASTHPGPGLAGASGEIVSRELTKPSRLGLRSGWSNK